MYRSKLGRSGGGLEVPEREKSLMEFYMRWWCMVVEVMLQVMNLVWRSESCPADWKRSLLVPLHKDGDNEEVGNYREVGCLRL